MFLFTHICTYGACMLCHAKRGEWGDTSGFNETVRQIGELLVRDANVSMTPQVGQRMQTFLDDVFYVTSKRTYVRLTSLYCHTQQKHI